MSISLALTVSWMIGGGLDTLPGVTSSKSFQDVVKHHSETVFDTIVPERLSIEKLSQRSSFARRAATECRPYS